MAGTKEERPAGVKRAWRPVVERAILLRPTNFRNHQRRLMQRIVQLAVLKGTVVQKVFDLIEPSVQFFDASQDTLSAWLKGRDRRSKRL